ncbi:MAG: BrxE family protein [Candidatus Binatia bacterium]
MLLLPVSLPGVYRFLSNSTSCCSVPIEDQFEEHWQNWLDEREKWAPIFEQLSTMTGSDLLTILDQFALVSHSQLDAVSKLRRSAENRAVPLPGTHTPNDDVITLLAAGFARGEPGNPAIPYARLEL